MLPARFCTLAITAITAALATRARYEHCILLVGLCPTSQNSSATRKAFHSAALRVVDANHIPHNTQRLVKA